MMKGALQVANHWIYVRQNFVRFYFIRGSKLSGDIYGVEPNIGVFTCVYPWKWMVYFMVPNPINKWDDLGGVFYHPYFLGSTPESEHPKKIATLCCWMFNLENQHGTSRWRWMVQMIFRSSIWVIFRFKKPLIFRGVFKKWYIWEPEWLPKNIRKKLVFFWRSMFWYVFIQKLWYPQIIHFNRVSGFPL